MKLKEIKRTIKQTLCCMRLLRSAASRGEQSAATFCDNPSAPFEILTPEPFLLPENSVVYLGSEADAREIRVEECGYTFSLTRLLEKRLSPLHKLSLEPFTDVVLTQPGEYRSLGNDPSFLLSSDQGRLPDGWVVVSFFGRFEKGSAPKLYYDEGYGINEKFHIDLCGIRKGVSTTLVKLPKFVYSLRFDPCDYAGDFALSCFKIEELNLVSPAKIKELEKSIFYLNPHYNSYLSSIEEERASGNHYPAWLKQEEAASEVDRLNAIAIIADCQGPPHFSIIMPTYNPILLYLKEAIESVIKQSYSNWQLCIADDCSIDPAVRLLLEEYEKKDSRIVCVYRDQRGHICEASNSALKIAKGDYTVLLDHDDTLAKDALLYVAEKIINNPDAAIIYSDEDKIHPGAQSSTGREDTVPSSEYRYSPHFKPDWDQYRILTQNYVSHLGVYKTSLITSIGGFRTGCEGAQDWDLLLRASELVEEAQIYHIPKILYHWRAAPGSVAISCENKPYAFKAGFKVINDCLARRNIAGNVEVNPEDSGSYRVRFAPPQEVKVRIIILSKDNPFYLNQCLQSVLKNTNYQNFGVTLVDNGSSSAEQLELIRTFLSNERFEVLSYSEKFNFSAMNNIAAARTDAAVVVFLNDDTEVLDPFWLDELTAIAMKQNVGAVGARLLYPNDTLQHAGIVLGVGGIANHAFYGLHYKRPGHQNRTRLVQQYSAVTAACMASRREVWLEIGGFDESNLPCCFNDVDYCLRLTQHNYKIVWTPFATLRHYESQSLGKLSTRSKESEELFKKESELMLKRWSEQLKRDPAYNPNFNQEAPDFAIYTASSKSRNS